MEQKRILMLGGIQEQIPAIQAAKEMGLYVITCDNRPDNPGHALADEYHNISITDKEAVLTLAQKLNVDAVVCYALEAGVQAAAYAQEELGKPTSPYQSVHTLSNKYLFREFLMLQGFSVPGMFHVQDKRQAHRQLKEALAEGMVTFPLVVKPADAWGSKGVNKVVEEKDFDDAVGSAFCYSLKGEVIVEEFIGGQPIEGDAFAIEGKLVHYLWGDVHYDLRSGNPLSPIAFTYPALLSDEEESLICTTLQRLMDILHMQTNAYNIEMRIVRKREESKLYLMEVAPRSGGSVIPLMVKSATGIDMVKNTILASLGEDCQDMYYSKAEGFWVNYKVHSNNNGILSSLLMEDTFKEKYFKMYYPNVAIGDIVKTYNGSSCTIGNVFAKFESREEMDSFIANSSDIIKVIVR